LPWHVARLVTWLVAPLVVDYSTSRRLVVDYSVRRDFVLRPRWLYFIHSVRRDYLSRGNTGSTSSMPRAATTSSSGRITSAIHLD
jgi:sigma54-dependent transcription regulator